MAGTKTREKRKQTRKRAMFGMLVAVLLAVSVMVLPAVAGVLVALAAVVTFMVSLVKFVFPQLDLIDLLVSLP